MHNKANYNSNQETQQIPDDNTKEPRNSNSTEQLQIEIDFSDSYDLNLQNLKYLDEAFADADEYDEYSEISFGTA